MQTVAYEKESKLIRMSCPTTSVEDMIMNIEYAGLSLDDIEVKELTDEEYDDIQALQPKPEPPIDNKQVQIDELAVQLGDVVLNSVTMEEYQASIEAKQTQIDDLTLQLGDALLTRVTREEHDTLVAENVSLKNQLDELTIQLGDALLNGGV